MNSAHGFRSIRTFVRIYAWIHMPLSSKQLVYDLDRELAYAYPHVIVVNVDVWLARRIHESWVVDQRRVV